MNIANAKKLVSQLERLPDEKFSMNVIVDHECGTKACIAGWCALLNGGPPDEGYAAAIINFAGEFLGLDKRNVQQLFWGNFRYENQPLADISRAQAIDELNRRIAEASAP